jgi:hypothetical protein
LFRKWVNAVLPFPGVDKLQSLSYSKNSVNHPNSKSSYALAAALRGVDSGIVEIDTASWVSVSNVKKLANHIRKAYPVQPSEVVLKMAVE